MGVSYSVDMLITKAYIDNEDVWLVTLLYICVFAHFVYHYI